MENTGASFAGICQALDTLFEKKTGSAISVEEMHCCYNEKYNKIHCESNKVIAETLGISTTNGVEQCNNGEKLSLAQSPVCGMDTDITPIDP